MARAVLGVGVPLHRPQGGQRYINSSGWNAGVSPARCGDITLAYPSSKVGDADLMRLAGSMSLAARYHILSGLGSFAFLILALLIFTFRSLRE